jgi:hypothetical protein
MSRKGNGGIMHHDGGFFSALKTESYSVGCIIYLLARPLNQTSLTFTRPTYAPNLKSEVRSAICAIYTAATLMPYNPETWFSIDFFMDA